MDKFTTHTLPDGREIFFVEVEDTARNPEIIQSIKDKPNKLYYRVDVFGLYVTNQRLVILPRGNWGIIGVSDDLKPIPMDQYRSLGLETNKRYVLLEKMK